MAIKHSVSTTGYLVRVEPMPPGHVLEQAPKEVRDALAALAAANEESRLATGEETRARKARRLEEVPSKISALDDALHEAEQASAARLKDAQRAARAVVRLLDAHADTIARDAARLTVSRHVRACDSLADLMEITGSPGWTPSRDPQELERWVEPHSQARPVGLAEFGRWLDETNVGALLERADMSAEDAGLVFVRSKSRHGVRFYTTPKRLAALGQNFEEVKA